MFIRHLHRQVIELVKQFSQDSVESVAFQPGDEMYTWLQTSMSATALSARGKGTEVYHFDLAASLVAGATIPLAFSTESIPLQFGITPADLTAIPISEYWGTLKKYPIMVFGLSPLASGGSNPKVTMQALFAYAGLGNPLFNVNLELIHPVSGSDNTLNRRNAIWFQPGGDYKTTLRLSFEVVEVADLNSFLQSIFGDKFELKTADVTLKRDARYKIVQQGEYTAQLESSITVVATAAVSVGTTLDFSLTMVLSDGGEFQAILDFDEGADILAVVDWLGSLVGLDTDFTNWLDADMMGSPKLSRVMLVFATVNGNSTFVNGTVTFQVDFKWGTETPEEKAVFLFTYSWPRGRLSASLWPGYQYLDPYIQIYPEYEPYQRLVPKDTGEIAGGLHLSKLIPNTVLPVPEHVVPDINAANVVLDKDQIYFDGSLVWNTEGKFGLPFLNLSEVRLAAAYNWKQKNVFLSLVVRGLLTPKSTELTPADLYGSITYFSDYGWSFEAMIYNLYLSSLYSFFDEDASDGVMDMLQTIELDLLRIKLDYDSAGKSSTFIIYGSVLLGPIKANLDYIHDLSGWTLNIGVGANSEAQASLGDIMHSLAGRNVNLPECVSSIALVKKATDTDTFTVTVRKKDDPTAGEHLVCHANFTLGGLGFTFVQLRKTGKSAPTKRVIKLAVNPLPNADVPLVGSVPQLFDEMTFMWVEDSSTTGQPGLTRQDVQIINNTIWSGSSSAQGIKFKDPQPANPKPTDIVLQKGLHFLIAVTHLGVSNVILDHRFGETRDKNNGSTLFSAAPAGSVVKAGSSGGAGEVTMAPMQKKTGPLSVSNIGLQFQDNTLYIVLDATFELGPVSMSLLGFGIGVNFSGGFNLQNLPTSLEVKLEGLGVGFEKPPISMAGQFRYSSIDNLYRGGITVAFQPYVFLAAGFYGDMKGKYKTVFVFAKLTGPLITLAFAEIAGICGGFGYNNKMTFPTVTQVPTFPFIGDNMGDQSPMDALAQLTGPGGWVQPKQDVYWLIAGMSVKAFRLLSVEAVVVVEFNPYVSLGLFALCQAGFPAKAVGGVRFLFIELGIAASVDFQAGTMKVEGQLTPNSFILAPSCHLTGGFALFYWFGDNANRGDWVFTIGGFHPSFIKPAHYPNPPRLGISWKLDSALSIVGESYFAITPKCCMAGGRLRATLSLGPLSAWFDAQTNLLINFNPFFFKGDVSVSVGVKFTLKLWIVTLRISVEIGAQLYLQGPPFAGRVHVNFWVFGFNINFGPSPVDQPPVDLEGFWEMLLQDGMVATRSAKASRRRRARALAANPAAAAAAATAAANTGDHVFAVQSGLLPTSSEDAETWDVRAGVFAFCVQSRFAIQEATCTGGAAVSDPTPIYAKPMQLTSPLSSKMNITVTKHNPTVKDEVDKWQLVKVVKAVPDALWGFYPSSSASKGNNIKELLSGTNLTVPLTMGITVASPRPVLSEDKIPKFNFVHAMAQDVFSPGEQRPDFPEVESVGGRFLPSKPEDGPKQWTVVKEAWSTPEAATAATQVLATWRKAFKWEDKEAVRGEPPKFAIQNFEEVYMSAPLLCAATA
ncbi:hypothetical protein FN846DRAFT_783189 [Sphaerosporella brunnea]|uniref:DUF6603 domain-containing protein n=1 Tax=Sphaerosporella brunnea TaxID=1250544 RepID=A0A5J5EM45_9PEZI|nr:hypothetical protein FN846DRAFT_783189 [Sphaerosporella brunnea]